MQSNNIISFPKPYNGPVKLSIDEIEQNTNMMKQYHIQETINNLIPIIFTQLDIAGFEFYDEDEDAESIDNLKEGAFIVESLRAAMLKQYDIYHPFQDLCDEIFEYDESEIEPILKIRDKINIDFKLEKKE